MEIRLQKDNEEVVRGLVSSGRIPHTVIIESTTYETMPYETVLEINPSLPSGTHKVVKKGVKGYKAKAWKVTLDKDGNEIAREVLCYSKYNQHNEVVQYNP